MLTVAVTVVQVSNDPEEYVAGVITHLIIANEILKSIPEGVILDKGMFF